jgi:hypothetical protein
MRPQETRSDARTLIGLYWLPEWSVNFAAHARQPQDSCIAHVPTTGNTLE